MLLVVDMLAPHEYEARPSWAALKTRASQVGCRLRFHVARPSDLAAETAPRVLHAFACEAALHQESQEDDGNHDSQPPVEAIAITIFILLGRGL